MKSLIIAIDRRITGLCLSLACAILAVISCLGMWQVVTRFVFSQPSTWTEEIMRRLLIWMVMLGTVVALRQGALISVDLMLRLSRGAWRSTVRWIITLVNLSFFSVVLWFGIDLVWRIRFQTFASLNLSMAWAYAAIPTGALLGLLATVAHHADPQHDELTTAL
ncbi:tripartite ATP-independent periplasmic transporter, DctQ component family protein [Hydrogenophaga sp. RAC07]|uniref:TRAP transporter small permease n=1 Tax=Hydrogenophaga sp. RAC07 TaxID=1842537 RepID=UPI00083E04F7|nr:TRAP transporter small permease [Hydrogenophaga sp. RAC07]AOF85424.1 tripartite ATP-independent periplasmic transporter, DctQ component family protein [Hydrogenophaga sp. RAC07]